MKDMRWIHKDSEGEHWRVQNQKATYSQRKLLSQGTDREQGSY